MPAFFVHTIVHCLFEVGVQASGLDRPIDASSNSPRSLWSFVYILLLLLFPTLFFSFPG